MYIVVVKYDHGNLGEEDVVVTVMVVADYVVMYHVEYCYNGFLAIQQLNREKL